jgi:hypothetical protein
MTTRSQALPEDRQSWPCTWQYVGADIEITWSNSITDTTRVVGQELRLEIRTGIVCVTAPCPTGWSETYEKAS